jgi:hypothetical protein
VTVEPVTENTGTHCRGFGRVAKFLGRFVPAR